MVAIRRLAQGEGLPLPAYMSAGASGADIVAALDAPLTLAPGARALVPAGFEMELPEGFEAQIRPRSGMALKTGVTVLNAPGTIDADYRGAVAVILINCGQESVTIVRGERIAQMVVMPVQQAVFIEAGTLGATARGEGGFGSTGQ